MTPEGKVKARVKELLISRGAHYQMPVTGGYGKGGCSDFLVCYKGFFIAVECKADESKPLSALQTREADAVRRAGGFFLKIYNTNILELSNLLDVIDIRERMRNGD